jgi:hypothetical protein
VEIVRQEIAKDITPCACGRPAGHKGWCKGRVAKSPSRQAVLDKLYQRKDENPALTLSRAFELVMREFEINIEGMREMSAGEDPEMDKCVAHEEDVLGTLRDYHPADSGFSVAMKYPSVYERAATSAQAELRTISMELQRLQARETALKGILAALEANGEAEKETR